MLVHFRSKEAGSIPSKCLLFSLSKSFCVHAGVCFTLVAYLPFCSTECCLVCPKVRMPYKANRQKNNIITSGGPFFKAIIPLVCAVQAAKLSNWTSRYVHVDHACMQDFRTCF